MSRGAVHSIYSMLVFTAVVSLFGLSSGCSVKKYIPEGEQLYTGAELKIDYPEGEKKDKNLELAMSRAIYPKPNSKFLGMYIGLWAYYKNEQDKAGIIARYINKRYGQEPVYLSNVDLRSTDDLLLNRAENRGYFFPDISSYTEIHKKKAKAIYQVSAGAPYRLATYQVLGDSTNSMDSILRVSLQNTLLDSASNFSLEDFKKERRRIDEYLKNRGYYFFNQDYLLFRSDTNQYDYRGFDLYLSLKEEVDQSMLKPYRLNNVKVLSNAESASDSLGADSDTLKGISYVQYPEWVKPQYLDDQIITNPDSAYRLKYAQNTVRRLSGLGAYQHANIRFSRSDSSSSKDGLDVTIYLTPARKYNIRAGMHGYTKSTGFAGPGLVLSFQDRNTFKGAEVLEIRGVAGYEFQISRGSGSGLNNFEFRLENSLSFPRLLAPLINFNPYRAYNIPNTRIHLNFNYQQRALYYSVNNFFTSYGYDWYTNPRVRWNLTPLSLSYMRVYNRTDEFEEILENNPFLARSFDDQFIPASSGGFRYSEFNDPLKIDRYFLDVNLEQAGLLTDLTSRDDSLLGQPFAQYVKADMDFRYDHKFSKDKHLVSRLFLGIGIPYGNSQSLPYIKQYFSGGPNSIRAFPVRSLGPGSYVPPQIDDNSFFDQAGDIRLEFNSEYRFPILGYLKGALFVDAGNIWLLNDNPSLPGAQFSSNWYKELAVGAGFGIRFDVQVVVVRLDIAHPVRYPSIDFRDFWNVDYGFSNIVWNFAIGYPF